MAIRLARRWLHRSRNAGILEAPPAMFDQIGPWMRAAYAGHILAQVDNELTRLRDAAGQLKDALNEMVQAERSLPRDLDRIQNKGNLRIRVVFVHWNKRLKTKIIGAKARDTDGTVQWRKPDGTWIVAEKGEPGWEPYYDWGQGDKRISWENAFRLTRDQIEKMLRKTLEDCIQNLHKHIQQLEQRADPQKDSGPTLVELTLMRRECLKYTGKAKLVKTKVSKVFPVNLAGWPYLEANSPLVTKANAQIVSRNAEIEEQLAVGKKALPLAQKAYDAKKNGDKDTYRKIIERLQADDWMDTSPGHPAWGDYNIRQALKENKRPDEVLVWGRTTYGYEPIPAAELEKELREPLGPSDIEKALATKRWATITCQLFFSQHQSRGGVWVTDKRTLQVDAKFTGARSLPKFQEGIAEVNRTLRHELQHVAQDLITTIAGLGEDAGGLPPEKTRDLSIPPSGDRGYNKPQQPHPLREVEFYTRLADEISEFLQNLPKYPKNLRAKVVRAWVDLDPKFTPEERKQVRHVPEREFFQMLHEEQPKKWRKAVSEFISEVGKKAELPSSFRVARRWLRKAAPPTDLDMKKVYYHGTSSAKAAKGILRSGIQPPNLTTRYDRTRPVEGKVYITPKLEYAAIYALGGVFAGHDYPTGHMKGGEYGYVFVIPGKELREIQPDEDNIGEMVYKQNPAWLHQLALDVLGDTRSGKPDRMGLSEDFDFDWLDEDEQQAFLESIGEAESEYDPWDHRIELEDWLQEHPDADMDGYWEYETQSLMSEVMQGKYSAWAEAGKLILPHLSDKEQLELIDAGAHIAHEGKLKPSQCWRIRKTDSIKLKANASNLFKVAERCR
jgi:hypothetical protein